LASPVAADPVSPPRYQGVGGTGALVTPAIHGVGGTGALVTPAIHGVGGTGALVTASIEWVVIAFRPIAQVRTKSTKRPTAIHLLFI
jgi:hypothetical protein